MFKNKASLDFNVEKIGSNARHIFQYAYLMSKTYVLVKIFQCQGLYFQGFTKILRINLLYYCICEMISSISKSDLLLKKNTNFGIIFRIKRD